MYIWSLYLQGMNVSNTRTSALNSRTYAADDNSVVSSVNSNSGASGRVYGFSKYGISISEHGVKDSSNCIVSVNVNTNTQSASALALIQRPTSPTSLAMDASFKKLLKGIRSSIDIATQVSVLCNVHVDYILPRVDNVL
jgi:hypothetical protein